VIHEGDCRDVLPTFAADSFDSVVTDPPYALTDIGRGMRMRRTGVSAHHDGANRTARGRTPTGGFMGQAWDSELPGVEVWSAVLRVLKPGGYMLTFGGTRTYHRLACAVEDAGFEIRDCLMWLYGTGFPKGRGCLKPAYEPILLCRKPGERVLPLGIDACRVPTDETLSQGSRKPGANFDDDDYQWEGKAGLQHTAGRYPANVVHDGSDEVLAAFAEFGEKKVPGTYRSTTMGAWKDDGVHEGYGDTGTAARFFYCAKASKRERAGSKHPTVKPLALVRWLVRLVTPEGGCVLDPFAGSGTTLEAAESEGFRAVGIEREAEHAADARRRLSRARETDGLFAATVP
jgi:site-specific DNA-methyltransferase (adenine-specific)